MTPPLRSSRSPGLRRYYGRLRPCASLRYFHPRGASTWISPLSSRRQVPTFRTRACVGLTPPICRTPLGQSAGSPRACPGALNIAPVSTSSVSFFDMSSVVRLHSSSRHAPDAVTPRLFSQRSPPRLLTAAAWDGLKPAPHKPTSRGLPSSLMQLRHFLSALSGCLVGASWHTLRNDTPRPRRSSDRTAASLGPRSPRFYPFRSPNMPPRSRLFAGFLAHPIAAESRFPVQGSWVWM